MPPLAQSVYDDLKLDGTWIDMNEPSNYCTGDICWNDGARLHSTAQSSPASVLCPCWSGWQIRSVALGYTQASVCPQSSSADHHSQSLLTS